MNNLVLLEYRIDALKYFLDSDDGANLLTAYRRAANILRIEEKKDGEQYTGQADPELFHQGEESALHERIGKAGKRAQDALEREGFQDAMSAMAGAASAGTPSSTTSRSTARTPRCAATGC